MGSRDLWGHTACGGLPCRLALSSGPWSCCCPCCSSYPPSLSALFRPSFSATSVPVTACYIRDMRKAWWTRPWRCSSSPRARSAELPARTPGNGRDGGVPRSLGAGAHQSSEPACGSVGRLPDSSALGRRWSRVLQQGQRREAQREIRKRSEGDRRQTAAGALLY